MESKAGNSGILHLETEQASFEKSIHFHPIKENRTENNNVLLLAQSNLLLQSSQVLTAASNWPIPSSSAVTLPGYCGEEQGIDKESLIELVRAYPSIWDIRSPLYKNQQRKNLA